ncbi:hypothetical protein [Sphingopyxis sp. JAI128]|uniref:hypothetical protein n=1 Tax=Sphingopyxis sp. JAI128 TaxID=2723066 RepID=UPI0016146AA0|nr:hypothetical protein [Sphingopyxis sp. JAI128]MBB6426341.1 hypothetical protein [Sphingopyxis sp. JAI128]
MLRSIADKISEHGDGALTDEERLIWNTALVISIMAGSDRMTMPPAAEILSWGSARAGFREMRLPVLAEIVRMIVLELVFRADRADGNGAADEASLLRLAELKRRFQEIDADIDLPLQLGRMIDRLYR